MGAEVFLIRHGQSTFNAAAEVIRQAAGEADDAVLWARFEALRGDLSLRDAPLSETGHRQGERRRTAVSAVRPKTSRLSSPASASIISTRCGGTPKSNTTGSLSSPRTSSLTGSPASRTRCRHGPRHVLPSSGTTCSSKRCVAGTSTTVKSFRFPCSRSGVAENPSS
jgi:hypothetical protein